MVPTSWSLPVTSSSILPPQAISPSGLSNHHPPSAAAPVTLVVAESVLGADLTVPRRLLAKLPLRWVPLSTPHLRRRGKRFPRLLDDSRRGAGRTRHRCALGHASSGPGGRGRGLRLRTSGQLHWGRGRLPRGRRNSGLRSRPGRSSCSAPGAGLPMTAAGCGVRWELHLRN